MSMPCQADANQTYNGHECVSNRSASVFYFVTTVSALLVLGTATLLFFCCLFIKRRRLQNQMRVGHQSMLPTLVPAPRGDMMMYDLSVYPPPVITPVGDTGPLPGAESVATGPHVPKNPEDGGQFHCVIMAGEERPTFIAHAVPPADNNVDDRSKVADGDVEQGNNVPKNRNR